MQNKTAGMVLFKNVGLVMTILFGLGSIGFLIYMTYETSRPHGSDVESMLIPLGILLFGFLMGIVYFAVGNSYLKKHNVSDSDKGVAKLFIKKFFLLFIPAAIIVMIIVFVFVSSNSNSRWDEIKDKTPSEMSDEDWEYIDDVMDYAEKNQ